MGRADPCCGVQYCPASSQLTVKTVRMDIGVEISLYPLHADFAPVIHEFLARLNAQAGLRVVTNSMSTQVFGPYEQVMATLQRELRATFVELENHALKAVFVMKVLGPLPSA
jgi:uncharacterized protein YqgV (UPF0045/DUF77 family)